jgi:hypothetical protein
MYFILKFSWENLENKNTHLKMGQYFFAKTVKISGQDFATRGDAPEKELWGTRDLSHFPKRSIEV